MAASGTWGNQNNRAKKLMKKARQTAKRMEAQNEKN
jgi:CHASE3 domain sensor protein